ncbi:TonB-dependent receptor [Niabella yanshanensis]|uniref:TonB-dependent receptor n=1 Tax=Niabella yanshanensis TaxID=577386 RepID=A0ABZ0W9Q7_9BACT|nr:TonB-dependent receptor [Niabella yanshanensis]WQD39254.1 TonB-dependent receptor [Niabella yanshanensis]
MQKSTLSGRYSLREPLLVMKLMCIMLVLALHVSAANYGQSVINIRAQETTVLNIFKQIEKQSSYSFFYSSNQLELNRPVYISAVNASLDAVLSKVFQGTKVAWKVIDNNKVVLSAAGEPVQSPLKTIKGIVTDQNGGPLENVSVTVKGRQIGTVTNAAGQFSIDADSGDILVFSNVGYIDQEVAIDGTSDLKITLKASESKMDEVVVIGYGSTKRRDLTGAVVSVKSEEITARPGPNPMESLQGRVAGLDITRPSGQAGAGVNIQLRGTRSFNASGNPLFIINGLPGDYATLNPYDIESIEVLKDASSTAAYGSAGSNGVIIITTKSGKAGKVNIDVNSYYGYNGWSITPTMRHGDSYLQTKRDAYSYLWNAATNKWETTNALWQSPVNDSAIFGSRYDAYREGQFTDWAGLLLRKNAATQNYSVGISGGNEKTKAYLSVNYTNEQSQYSGDDYKLLTTSMRIDHKLRKWINVGANLQSSYVIRNKAQDKLENLITTDPLAQPYKADGTLNPDLGNNVYNLLLDYQPGVYSNLDNNFRMFLNPYVEIKPLKGLSILSRAGATLAYSNNYRFDGKGSVAYTYNNANVTKAQIQQNRFIGYQWENILTYNVKIASDHDLTLTAVSSYYDNQNSSNNITQNNVYSNNFKWHNIKNDPTNTIATSSYNMSRTFGLLGRINYSYLGKYLFSASVRRDGSSVLDKDHQWDNFPAASMGWRISDEKFMDATRDWLDNLKFRIGWGITGSAKIDPYSSVAMVENANTSLGGITTPIFRNSALIANPVLGWEKSYNTNYGMDASFLNGRIDLSFDYYRTKTKDVIYKVNMPIIYGAYTPGVSYARNINLCETMNTGFELALNTKNVVTNNFEWTSAIAFSTNKEKVLNLIGGTSNFIPFDVHTLVLGQPVKTFWNYKLDGVWQIGEEADAAVFGAIPGTLKVNVPGMTRLAEGVYMKETGSGSNAVRKYYYTNLADAQQFDPSLTAANSKYTYSNNDFQVLGSNVPKWSLGLQNSFKYKNFDLGIYMYMRWGQMINYNLMGWYQPNAFAINASPSRTFPASFNYWTPTNPSNDFPVMNYDYGTNRFLGFTGLNYVDGSFLKIKNITLGYTLPVNISRKASIEKLRFYGTVTNPLIVARSHFLKEYDPEMNGSLEYPLTKQVVLGLNITF